MEKILCFRTSALHLNHITCPQVVLCAIHLYTTNDQQFSNPTFCFTEIIESLFLSKCLLILQDGISVDVEVIHLYPV